MRKVNEDNITDNHVATMQKQKTYTNVVQSNALEDQYCNITFHSINLM